ncbi:major facilitator superfamily domain-containing protein 1-like [Patiria miniata]|uniref:Lysosomal dipeptide transporter MFSD1 n=1 Tax=Patiria miniata TaxID=46514 RepID=A0A913ZDJ4_PATMI|nr:major facilitator superfamily domain-containing protein 1-like [Patiria miniata]
MADDGNHHPQGIPHSINSNFDDDFEKSDENSPLLSSGVPRGASCNDVEYRGPLTGCGAWKLCDPRSAWHRYTFILILTCLLSFGSYYCYDTPSALEEVIKDDMQIDTSTYELLYSLYSWPNVVLCFFGGFLLDRVFGIRIGTLVFGGFVLTGQLIFALGALFDSWICMVAGRFVFGLGGENLAVAQNTYAVTWFKEKELNMVFGLQLSFSRIGSTLNMNVNKPIYDSINNDLLPYQRLGYTLLVGVAMCVFSVICGIVIGILDFRAEKLLNRNKASTGEVIRIRDIKDFPANLWLIFLICVFYYITVFPFITIGVVFFSEKYELTPAAANIVNSLVYFISAGASPIFGFIVDKTGRNIFWVIIGTVITLGCHLTLAFTFITPFAVMSVMGLAYSILACSLWPLVAFIMPEHQLGTSYGFMQSIQNLGLAVVSIIVGVIVDGSGYLILEVFMCAMLCVAIMFSVLLYLIDASRGTGLNFSAKERRLIKEAKKREKEMQTSCD